MFSKLFTRNPPVEIEKIEPDEMFLAWLHQMRNPSTDSASQHTVKPDPTVAHPSTRPAA